MTTRPFHAICRRLRENLRQAGLVSEAVLEQAIAAAGKQALEAAWVWTRPDDDLLRACVAADPAEEAAIRADGRSVVFLTPPLGCFEVIAQYYMLRPVGRARPMTALYRVPHKPALRPLLEAARAHRGLRLAPAELAGVRKLIRALKNREVVGILPDQVPSQGDGVWAPFFGRPAYTMTLPARLAVTQQAIVAFIYAERLPRGRGFRLHWERVAAPLTGDPPSLRAIPAGCRFHPRCPLAIVRCTEVGPTEELAAPGHLVTCHRWRETAPVEKVPA